MPHNSQPAGAPPADAGPRILLILLALILAAGVAGTAVGLAAR
ncbi:hypothetical protein [Micromonospora rubida]